MTLKSFLAIIRWTRVRKRGHQDRPIPAWARKWSLPHLHTLAESTQHLSLELKNAQPEIPWDDIAAFRDRIVHGYLGVSIDIVWDIIQRDMPPLRTSPGQASICTASEKGPSEGQITSSDSASKLGGNDGEQLVRVSGGTLPAAARETVFDLAA